MKVIVAVLLVLGALVLAGGCSGEFTSWYTDANGVVHTHCWGGCTSATDLGPGSTVRDSPAVEDALALQAAGNSSTSAVAAVKGVIAMLNRALHERDAAAAALIRRKLPALATTIESEMPGVRDRLLAVDLHTTVGQTCRVAVLRMVAKTQSLFGSISRELAAGRTPAKVVFDVMHGMNTVNAALKADLRPCLAGVQPDERPAVKYVLGG